MPMSLQLDQDQLPILPENWERVGPTKRAVQHNQGPHSGASFSVSFVIELDSIDLCILTARLTGRSDACTHHQRRKSQNRNNPGRHG